MSGAAPADGGRIPLAFHPWDASGAAPALLVLLPGFGMSVTDPADQGLVAALRAGADPVDLAVAAPDLDLYLDGTVGDPLAAAIAGLCRPGRRLVLGGISLGCIGAVLAAARPPAAVDGVLLLSPFLGAPGLIAEVARAGGLAAWRPGTVADNDGERRALAWLQSHLRHGGARPALHLGYGRSDRFVTTALLLAALLPAAQVHIVDGDHDWPTWAALWRNLVAARPFKAQEGPGPVAGPDEAGVVG